MTTGHAPPSTTDYGDRIAIVGMSGRFPGAADVDELWAKVRAGASGLTTFSPDDLRSMGVSEALLNSPRYVRRRGVLDGADLWDAEFFGVSPKEAELTDPQHRVFLECAWSALEDAGFAPPRLRQPAGVFAASSLSAYLYHLVRMGAADVFGHTGLVIRNDKDYLAAWVAYKLGLHGPAVAIQTACSSSLVAVHVACQSLLAGDCNVALAGGVSIRVPTRGGYLYEEGGIDSPDGCCRPFDAAANGTIAGDGAGAIVLVRLEDAIQHGDRIVAVIAGSAVSNDGADKAGFTAPGVRGQVAAIRQALAASGRSSGDVRYVEAHGTGTRLGDPVEVRALTRAFASDRRQYCALGSIKANVGHLDAAAGITGIIKVALALAYGEIPPHANFTQANPEIDFASTPFFVPGAPLPWPPTDWPRCAGVSAFGIGGTNAHVVLEEPPAVGRHGDRAGPARLIVLSARTAGALKALTERCVRYFDGAPAGEFADAAFTLAAGRAPFVERRFVVARDGAEAARRLADPSAVRPRTGRAAATPPRVAFMFPGQHALQVGCGKELYEHLPVFRDWIDRAAHVLTGEIPWDLRAVLWEPDSAGGGRTGEDPLGRTEFVQPVLFALEVALAQTWRASGIEPVALLGHSLGEWVAATLAGVFDFADALKTVAWRGRLMQALPAGGMWAVVGSSNDIEREIEARWDLAAVNAPGASVVSAPLEADVEVTRWAESRGLTLVRLPTSHAFHSRLLDPALADLRRRVEAVHRSTPATPVVSNVTGTWLTEDQALDAGYWAQHARRTVRFDHGLAALAGAADLLIEMGPGHTLTSFARQVGIPVLPALDDRAGRLAAALEGLGAAWTRGAAVEPAELFAGDRRRRVRLPTYPFQRTRHWYTPEGQEPRAPLASGSAAAVHSHDTATPPGPTTLPAADAEIEAIIEGQLRIMREQLALLQEASEAAQGRVPQP